MADPKGPGGRPSSFTQEMGDQIIDLIAEGESVRAICRRDGMPAMSTVFRWLAEIEAFSEQYARACEVRAALIFDEVLDISDTPMMGEKRKVISGGGDGDKIEVMEGDMIEHRRLQIDARKWVLARMAPKKYGDKLDLGGSLGVTVTFAGDDSNL